MRFNIGFSLVVIFSPFMVLKSLWQMKRTLKMNLSFHLIFRMVETFRWGLWWTLFRAKTRKFIRNVLILSKGFSWSSLMINHGFKKSRSGFLKTFPCEKSRIFFSTMRLSVTRVSSLKIKLHNLIILPLKSVFISNKVFHRN